MNLVRRQFLSLAGASLTSVLAGPYISPTAYAQTDFPNRPIHIVLPYPVGGIVDVATRIVTDKLSEIWSQPIGAARH